MHARLIYAVIVAGAVAAAPGATQAQSSQDYLRALQPPTSVGGASRGIRPAAPADAAPASTPAAASPGSVRSGGQAGAQGSAGRSAATMPRSRPSTAARTSAADAGSGEVNIFIEFRSGSAQLTPPAMRVLNNLGGALTNTRLAGYRFRIEGHTDTVGLPESNKALSEQRAQAVVTYLKERFHIDSGKLDAVGLGETDLLVPTPPQTPEARNRRVRVVNLGA